MLAFVGRPREILVRFVRTGVYDDAGLARRAWAGLGPEERSALLRIRAPEARRDSLAAHALARAMLARIAGCPPSQLRFHVAPGGRPEVTAPPPARRLRFNLSHADGIALCAVAAGVLVGADVESRRNVGPDPLGVAATICSLRERDALQASPPAQQAERFLAPWTMKEAIAKAAGHGLGVPLNNVRVDDGSPWQVAVLRLTPDHLAAVAVDSDGDDLAIRCEEERPAFPAPMRPWVPSRAAV